LLKSFFYFLIIYFLFNSSLIFSEEKPSRDGNTVYDVACAVCHQNGLAGAPIFGDKSSWGYRVNKSLDELTLSVKNGLRGMPAMGLCMNCTDRELESAVSYILSSL
jgi:cytochrome c5